MTTPPTPHGPSSGSGESDDRVEELARLRADLARLETDLGVPSDPEPPRRSSWWRGGFIVVCLTLVAVLSPLAVVATWAHDIVGDTDRYVETVAPLAEDPAVQAAVSERVTARINDALDIPSVVDEAVDALAARGVPPRVQASLQALSSPLAQGIEGFIGEQVRRIVESDAFATAWEQANRVASGQMVKVLTGETDGAVSVSGDTVEIDLGPVIDAVRQRLVDRGFGLADRITDVSTQITVFQSADLAKAQTGFRILSALARALPIAALVLLGIAVAVSRRRRRTLVIGSLVVVGSMLALGLVLNAFRVVYLDAVPTDRLPTDAAAAIYDQLVGFIRLNLRALAVLFLAIAAVAWVAGPDPAPTALRRQTGRVLDRVRRGARGAGLDTGPVGDFLSAYRTAIRVVVAGAVILVYVLADHPTGAWTFGLLLIGALVLLVVELLARPPEQSGAPTG